MDLAYHALTGLVLSKAITGEIMPQAVLAALIPDLIGVAGYQYLKIANANRSSPRLFIEDFIRFTRRDTYLNIWDRKTYRLTHSWLAIPIATAVFFLLMREQAGILGLSYASHLLIDIPTHRGDFAQRPFYPFSDWHIEGVNWSDNTYIFMLFWGILLGILVIQFFF